MKNAAGDLKCDVYIREELEKAHIPYHDFGIPFPNQEVPTGIIGHLCGWTFKRAWYYWIARTDKAPLLFCYADELHEIHGREVRVAGHCCCPAPREWYDADVYIGVNLYHVDTQEGLNALAEAIRKQAKMRNKTNDDPK